MAAMTATVYVGAAATIEQVTAAVGAWQKQAGDTARLFIDTGADLYEGLGYSIDIYGPPAETRAYVRELADGIRPLLGGIPVVVDDDADAAVLAGRSPAAPLPV